MPQRVLYPGVASSSLSFAQGGIAIPERCASCEGVLFPGAPICRNEDGSVYHPKCYPPSRVSPEEGVESCTGARSASETELASSLLNHLAPAFHLPGVVSCSSLPEECPLPLTCLLPEAVDRFPSIMSGQDPIHTRHLLISAQACSIIDKLIAAQGIVIGAVFFRKHEDQMTVGAISSSSHHNAVDLIAKANAEMPL